MRLSWIPNALCVLRMILVVPIVLALLQRRFELALSLVIAAGFSDAVDGFLAKRFHWRSRLGSLLDPAADKLLVTSVFLTLTFAGLVPLGVALIVIGRDVVIVGGVLAYQLLIEPVRGAPTPISKLNTACQLAFLVFAMTRAAYAWPPQVALTVLGAAVVFTSITSGLSYVLQGSKLAWRAKHGGAVAP
jgi:cardiolipin synthase (CMP-forming)